MRHGFSAIALHGDMDQSARTAALEQFRRGEVKLLVASDVAARGLDIPAVSHVFNFDVPHHPDDYVHRIGRTGRAGRSGIAMTIVAPIDTKAVAAIEKLIGQTIAVVGRASGGERRAPPAARGARSAASRAHAKAATATAAPAAQRQPRQRRRAAASANAQPRERSPQPRQRAINRRATGDRSRDGQRLAGRTLATRRPRRPRRARKPTITRSPPRHSCCDRSRVKA